MCVLLYFLFTSFHAAYVKWFLEIFIQIWFVFPCISIFFYFSICNIKNTNHSGENFEKPNIYTSTHYKKLWLWKRFFNVLPYCFVRTGIGGVVAPSPRAKCKMKKKNHFMFQSSVRHRIFSFIFEKSKTIP